MCLPIVTPRMLIAVSTPMAASAIKSEGGDRRSSNVPAWMAKIYADRADAAGTNERQLRPGEDEADNGAERPREIDVFAARLRIGARQFGEAERPDEREQTADEPGAERRKTVRGDRSNTLDGGLKDADADDDADHQARRVPEPQMGGTRRRFSRNL